MIAWLLFWIAGGTGGGPVVSPTAVRVVDSSRRALTTTDTSGPVVCVVASSLYPD